MALRMTTVNAQYNIAKPASLPVRIAAHQRRRMFADFMRCMRPEEQDTILDVGATSDETYDHSNYLLAWYPYKHRITAVGLDDADFLEVKYPGVIFRKADARALPFFDDSFDYVHSSAVLEHVGSCEEQTRFLAELWRVSRKGVYLTTPNRWFPIEFHTTLPLVHWLPRHWFATILRWLRLDFFSDEANLNLLSRRKLMRMASVCGMDRPRITNVALLGWPTNLLLSARKA